MSATKHGVLLQHQAHYHLQGATAHMRSVQHVATKSLAFVGGTTSQPSLCLGPLLERQHESWCVTCPTACCMCRCMLGLHYWGDRKANAALQMALAVGKSSLLPALAHNLLTLHADLVGGLGVYGAHVMLVRGKHHAHKTVLLSRILLN